jgi:hypothetical protein
MGDFHVFPPVGIRRERQQASILAGKGPDDAAQRFGALPSRNQVVESNPPARIRTVVIHVNERQEDVPNPGPLTFAQLLVNAICFPSQCATHSAHPFERLHRLSAGLHFVPDSGEREFEQR